MKASNTSRVHALLALLAFSAICALPDVSRGQSPLPPTAWQRGTQQSHGRPAPWGNNDRRRIIVRLPNGESQASGELLVQPDVQVLQGPQATRYQPQIPQRQQRPPANAAPASWVGLGQILQAETGPSPEVIPAPIQHTPHMPQTILGNSMQTMEALPDSIVQSVAEPIFDAILKSSKCKCEPGFFHGWFHHKQGPFADIGIGRERVALAPFFIDISQPMRNFRIRFDSAWGMEFPDRAEFFWNKNRGPGFDVAVDYQDVRMMHEVGGGKFSVQTEIPIRMIDPLLQGNTAGMGDMSVTTKTVLLEGKTWQITQILRTETPTGSASHGIGRGFVAMEPGLLARIKWDDKTYFHSELKYWFPLGADPNHSGQVMRYGMGFSRLWWETDSTAAIPTFEMVGWTVLDGRKTVLPGVTQEVDGDAIITLNPGMRYVWDPNGDLGLWELGIAGSLAISNNHWYESMVRAELRWSF